MFDPVFVVYIAPFLIGLAVRVAFCRVHKGYFATVALAVLMAALWIRGILFPTRGDYELLALLAGAATMATVGALLVEICLCVVRRVKAKKEFDSAEKPLEK